LPLVGIYRDDEDLENSNVVLELRNCTTCRSTMAIPLTEKRPDVEDY
jgi:hypothetical protein